MEKLKHKPTVLGIVAFSALFLALVSWALSSPPGSSPDDDFHLPSIWCGQGERPTLCEVITEKTLKYRVPEPVALAGWYALGCSKLDSTASASCEYNLDPEKNYDVERINNGEYPINYYWVQSWLASDSLNVSVLLMRAFNIFVFCSSLAVLWFVSSKRMSKKLLITVAVTVVPLGLFVVASNNPSSWAVTSAFLVLPAAYQYFDKEQSRSHRLTLLGLICFGFLLANFSRADSAIFAVIALSVALFLRGSKTNLSTFNILVFTALTLWSLSTYFSRVTGVQGLLGFKSESKFQWFQDPNLWTNLLNLPSLWAGVFGSWNLGWFEVKMPALVWIFSGGVFFAILFITLQQISWRKLIVLTFLMSVLIALPIFALSQAGTTVGWVVQPRYLLPLIIIFTITALISDENEKHIIHFTCAQSLAVFLLLTLSFAASLHQTIRRYISGDDIVSPNLMDGLEWWWPRLSLVSPNFIQLIGIFSWGIFLFVVFLKPKLFKFHSVADKLKLIR